MNMAVTVQSGARPPHVEFYEAHVEDRTASLAAGHYVAKPVTMVRVRQTGSKDSVDRDAEDWLSQLNKNGSILPEWAARFKIMYQQYKEGQEPVIDGTDLRTYAAISPAQLHTLRAAGLRSVEDLANANEPTLQRIGMEARRLQREARAWIDTAKSTGVASAELAALREKDAQRDVEMEEMRKMLASLRAQVPAAGAKTVAEEDDFLGTPKEKKGK
jgi:hypothetical protein